MKLNNKGITLTSLVIMIIALLILASITTYGGTELIKRANLENLKTNMLLIQAEAKKAVEEFNFKEYALPEGEGREAQVDVLKQENLIGNEINDSIKNKLKDILKSEGISDENIDDELAKCYYLKEDDLSKINVNIDLSENEYYVIKYDFDELTAEIYYTKGYKYNNVTYYSLSQFISINN